MGGLALKHLNVQRVSRDEYLRLAPRVQSIFSTLFQHLPDIVQSYAQKTDFGDCDMLITSSELPERWRDGLAAAVHSRGYIVNGDVTSMEIENVQFDFINVPRAHRVYAFVYFSFNDLGNLMGRVAHKMGFKYGHRGLVYPMRVDNNHVYAEVDVRAPINEVFDFLGYSFHLWNSGFDSLEDIFEYAASTPYFNRDIYLLENRNAISRMRDAKRKTYTGFLEWCERNHDKNQYDWSDKDGEKAKHLQRAVERWPGLGVTLETLNRAFRQEQDLKTRWNGENVMKWTGLSGKELGLFMSHVRNHINFDEASRNVDVLEAFVKALYESM